MRVSKEKTAVACRNIVKEYTVGGEGVRVLDGISLRVSSGEFVSIMGESVPERVRSSISWGDWTDLQREMSA